MSYIGKSPSQGVRQRYYFTATGGETSLSGADDNGVILIFTDGAYVDVYLNGILLVAGTDYNTTTTNTISSLTALAASDIVEIVVYDVFSVADTVSASAGGTFNADVKVLGKVGIGTSSPDEALHISASDSATLRIESTDTSLVANQVVGAIEWESNESSVGSDGVVGKIDLIAEDTTPEYAMRFFTHDTSGGVPDFGERLRIDSSGNVGIGTSSPSEVIHGNGSAVSGLLLTTDTYGSGSLFKVQGDGSAYIYNRENSFLRFGTNNLERVRIDNSGNVGIGIADPADKLQVANTSGNVSIALEANTTGTSSIKLGDTANTSAGEIIYDNSDNSLGFNTAATERMRIDSSGTVTATAINAPQSSQTSIGATCMGWLNNTTTNPGTSRAGTSISFSNTIGGYRPSTFGVGTWRCHGAVQSGSLNQEVSVWQRIS